MASMKQDMEKAGADPIHHMNVRVKCLLENGGVTRHSFEGNSEEAGNFMGKLKGRVMEIQFVSRSAIKQMSEENYDAI